MQPHDAATLLAGVTVPWWVAGGWAIDLFLGFQTRAHNDFDVGVLRRDVTTLIPNLAGWEIFEAKSQMLSRLDDCEHPRPDVNSLWCRPCNAQDWSLELMLDEADGDAWAFRRLPTIRMPLASVIRRTSDGIPYLTPEIQLLYKARHPRPKDHDDFERVLVRLGSGERVWLCDALSTVDPEHAWLTKLRS
jgi:hypothetical protein